MPCWLEMLLGLGLGAFVVEGVPRLPRLLRRRQRQLTHISGIPLPDADDPRWTHIGWKHGEWRGLALGRIEIHFQESDKAVKLLVGDVAVKSRASKRYCRAVIRAYQAKRALYSIENAT